MSVMKKVLFTINVHSIVDTITNSSSELFVGTSNSKEELIMLIENVYPDFRNEYEDIKHIDELDMGELENYFWFVCSAHQWPATKEMYPVLNGFTFDELYEKESEEKHWMGDYDYKLKDNRIDKSNKWGKCFITEENFEEIKNKLDPERKMFFMYSKGENPDWEYQEKLSCFMDRIHMG